jgi:hypothetical protein
MRGKSSTLDRLRETTRRGPSKHTIFLQPLAGTREEGSRVVIRNDVYVRALEAARQVLRTYHSERRRQL